MERQIVVNKGKCPHCGDIIKSVHRHDFVTCQCGKSSLDGGLDYVRVVGDTIAYPLYIDDDFELIRLHFTTLIRDFAKSKQVPLAKLKTEYLQQALDYAEEKEIENVHVTLYKKELEYRDKNSIFVTD